MQNLIISLVAIALYLAASVRIVVTTTGRATRKTAKKYQATMLLITAILAHAATLSFTVGANDGFDLGIFNMASLVGWFIGFFLLMIMSWRPVDSLAVMIYPIIALMIALAYLFPSSHILPPGTAFGIQLHIVLSIIAYGLFAIAAAQATYLGIADYKLRHHRPSMDFMPPLPTMEIVLFQLTGFAFVILTLSLMLGAMYIEDMRAQHLTHKITFSAIAWGVFATLLYGRWRFGWRGRRAIKYVLSGFTSLALGFFGSKAVLELVLHRV
ncbi:MAG TPA: phosphohydrolase [Gammaproteobacteria bacterium]|nr:phosphohydrolase [Gammaproteobacteria bacterium]|tara:strand:+ start:1867 stop:2673 length:807 start_codon:yes stop_codon:yes gene_type:complete